MWIARSAGFAPVLNSDNQKPDQSEKVVGCLFPVIGGFVGIVIGMMVAKIVAPIIGDFFYVPGNKLSGLGEESFAALVIVVGSSLTGLISFSYFELRRRQ
jgi:hypothetical protein